MCFYMLLAGGNWNNGSYCGSLCRNGNNPRSNANSNIGRRGQCAIQFLKTNGLRTLAEHINRVHNNLCAKHENRGV